MKKLLCILFIICVFTSYTKNEPSSYRVFIIQDSIRTEVLFNTNVLKLKKKPFKIEVQLYNKLEGAFVSASYDPMYYNTPINKRFKDWENITSKTMAESTYNADKELAVSKEAICYWFYEAGEVNRFDPAVHVTDTMVAGTKTIENIFNNDTKKSLKISKIKAPLYLVFFYLDYKEDYTHNKSDKYTAEKEYERKRIKLLFE